MASPTSPSSIPTSLSGSFKATAGRGAQSSGQSFRALLAASAVGFAMFGAQFALFILLNSKLSRIYAPRTFLVPERERTEAPPKGLFQWLIPVFKTSNLDFMKRCGLDAYFFLRYLRALLKIFIPMAFIIMPILLPLNLIGGRGDHFATGSFNNGKWQNVEGLDQLAWGNVRPQNTNRYWAHLVLAVGVVIWTCFVFFDELRGYIRIRQDYLTSPQHRLRASATTVLVTAIPTKWCTFEALDGLYDVFPGGIRNIWINRNFDDLNDKIKRRNKLAKALESAETNLIQKAKKAQSGKVMEEAKKAGGKKPKEDRMHFPNDQRLAMAQVDGISSGDPHQVRHTIEEALAESSCEPWKEQSLDRKKHMLPVPILGQGGDAVGHGIGTVGKTVFGGLRNVGKNIDERLNTTGGFVPNTADTRSEARAKLCFDGSRSRSVSPEAGHHKAHDASRRNQDPSVRGISNDITMKHGISQDGAVHSDSQLNAGHQGLGIDGAPVDSRANRNSVDSDVLHQPQGLGGVGDIHMSRLKFWERGKVKPYGVPSPTPHGLEEDEFPLGRPSPMTPGCNPQATVNGPDFHIGQEKGNKPSKQSRSTKSSAGEVKARTYPVAFNEEYNPNSGKPLWKKYLRDKDRETMRLPIFGWQWMISLPLLGKKVDTIDYCRKEVARLNLEIEQDQREPEKYPLMNSAFIQFNHQVAAHMACQAVSHHTPAQMAPRAVEISPDDVIWDNMSIRWWESYIRTSAVIIIIVGMVIGWAIPVSFTGALSNLNELGDNYKWLEWLKKIPNVLKFAIQGVLPPGLLALLLVLLPLILRFLAKTQGDHTGMAVELSVQRYYFAFLFFQVFLVVSISSAITDVIDDIIHSPETAPALLAEDLPKSSNYFFSYLLLQALTVGAGALAQVGELIQWFVLAPLLDSTARQKWRRQVNLPNMQWGSFFPVYTNLACIGLIYSVISPLILVFNIITFSFFWLVYRYNTLYVTKFRFDTGGLLFPTAINQLFTGLYVMELVLIGLFFLVKEATDNGDAFGTPCKVQGIIMIVVLFFTVLYQWLLNRAFSPLLRYLPITLEDDAVERDEEFAQAHEKLWNMEEGEQSGDNINDVLVEHERRSAGEERDPEAIEMQDIRAHPDRGRLDLSNLSILVPEAVSHVIPARSSWADRSRNKYPKSPAFKSPRQRPYPRQPRTPPTKDLEAQGRSGTNAIGEALFAGINDEIEDLTPDERDKLVQRAFQHEALRARRPVIWIPRDDLGVSDDEILRTKEFSSHIWVSNEFTGLDRKGRVVYRKSPPDFSEVDLIEL